MAIPACRQAHGRLAALVSAALFLSLLVAGPASAAVCRVTPSVGGSYDGSSWAKPMLLQTALTTSTCTEIWVAAGVYKPGMTVTDTFNIPPSVVVYGGFVGNETSRDQRDAAANVTILSGDIDNNDTNTDGNNIDETSADIQGSNSYHVVTTSTIVNETQQISVLDGFTITGGYANGNLISIPERSGGGLFCTGGVGSGCYVVLNNIRFIGNRASLRGGAMYDFTYGGISQPMLSNVTFSGNNAPSGGAMYDASDSGGFGSPRFSDVTFAENSATNGGALYDDGSSNGRSDPYLSNVTFYANGASQSGGAIYSDGRYSGHSDPSLYNVTFSDNSADTGGGMYNNSDNAGTTDPTLSNVILWGQLVITSGPEIVNHAGSGTASLAIDHSVVELSGGSGTGWDTTLGTDGGGNIDADPLVGPLGMHGGATATMVPSAAGSAVDAGNDTTCSNPDTVNNLDQRGVTRPQGPHCDIGAVENDVIFADGFEGMP